MFKKLALSLGLLLVLVALLEFGTGLWLTQFAGDEAFIKYASFRQLADRKLDTGGASFKLEPHRYLGYAPTPNYESADGQNRHNGLGFRGADIPVKKPEGEIRIVCLGGSTTYTTSVEDHTKTYPAQLEALLRAKGHEVRVINGGCGGWSSWESLINFQLRALELDPDVVIVYHGVNDIHARMVWPPNRYRGDNSGRRAPSAGGAFMPSLLEHSNLYRLIAVSQGSMRAHVDISRTIDRFPGSFHQGNFRRQVQNGSYPSGIFEKTPAQKMLDTNQPTHFKRNLEGIVHTAQGHGVVPVLATFATHPGFAREVEVSSPEYRRAYPEMNAVVREVCDETGARYFDFASAFPKDKALYVDGRHVTVGGARKKAGLFAEFLEQHVLVGELAPGR